MYVKSFVNPEEKGTTISNYANDVITKPCYIFKDNQVLISLSSRDLSFIIEDNLSNIFSLLAAHRTQVNLMQNSAISFSFCANYEERNFDTLIQDLERDYAIEITKELQLITIFNYKSEQNALNKVLQGRDVILEQLSSKVIQLVVKQ